MPVDLDRFRSAKNTLRTRLVMVGVFVGAILALSLSVTFSWGNDAKGGAGGGRAEMSEQAQAAFHSPPGSCLTWTQPDASDIRTVPCAEKHLFEVTGVVDIADQFPPGAPSPDVAKWREIAQARCSDGAKTYLGKPLDPYGKLTVSALRPADEEWNDGARELRCVLQWAGPGGGLQPLTGPAKDQKQANIWEPGTCLALVGKTVGDPVDCTQPHAYEIVGELDLKTKFTNGYPKQDDQKAWLDTECFKAVQEYTGGDDFSAQKLILTWDVREQESWDAGSTQVNCKVGAKLPDGSGLSPVTGSIKKSTPPPGTEPPSPPPSSTGGG
ncbi:septum formation family protein [Amycolatopsis anabasis]|uniref:septum formation family protein n=1 Tax=Amycolatopsis anabasis TaxID=1840409 RepID=UPI00131D68B7|nr:septum formation family protein [Amycolatopsis anabasis]